MKVVNSISTLYISSYPIAVALKNKIDNLIKKEKKESWHYFSRIKKQESFALKLETGRFNGNSILDDLFACTLVVENINEIQTSINFINNFFEIKERKPQKDNFTHKDSHSFQFDDLRLYVSLKELDYIPNEKLSSITFELQIKTFLQHAWTIATHDLIYKSENISWSKERVAYQIKAMLEQAEMSIVGVNQLSLLPELLKENSITQKLNLINAFLKDNFPSESLPMDLIRLSKIVHQIIDLLKINLSTLKTIVNKETELGRGTKTLNLSPYGIIIQSIITQEPGLIEKALKKNYNSKTPIFIPQEVNIDKLNIEDIKRIIRI